MERNQNPWLTELLSWHGHDRGGVRVPFHPTMGRPLGDVIDTPLLDKIRRLALDLVADVPESPRWIFLIGGPGNGKSEAVEAFIRELDRAADSGGILSSLLSPMFVGEAIAPRRVQITQDELRGTLLENTVRGLTIIQDASAVDGPAHVAEEVLIEELAELVTSPTGQESVFMCCANRGLIARARSAIREQERYDWLNVDEVTELLTQLLTATGLGPEALATDRPGCWPLETDSRFAAWPLDLDSIISSGGDDSPFQRMIQVAVDPERWSGQGSCGDCDSRGLCPFYANAQMLHTMEAQCRLLTMLRHSEIATGQRWNFRDSFSLCAEIIVGQRDDFDSGDSSPCQWVHTRADEIRYGSQASSKLAAAWDLTFHLYSQALFPEWPNSLDDLDQSTIATSELTRIALESISQRQRTSGAQIRSILVGGFSKRLDPALATPSDNESLIRLVEDEFGQSIWQGHETLKHKLNPIVRQLLELMVKAEEDWTEFARESRQIASIRESLRVISSVLCKRYLGVYEGEYLNQRELTEYEDMLSDQDRLRDLVPALRQILAPADKFGASLIGVFGQPPTEASKDVQVVHALGSVVPRHAAESTQGRPGHEVPWIEVQEHHVPLTFDLFEALRAHEAGAQLASFAPHTRAALDKVRIAIGGTSARNREGMLGGEVTIRLGSFGSLRLDANGSVTFAES